MHDMPSITLLQQSHAIPKTGEELEVLGKYAAKQYAAGTCGTLNEAVVETVKHAGLSPEQVRRVIEFANVNAYLTEFGKEGSAHKYIEFHGGPADPAEVLRDLNDGGGGTVFDRGLADYSIQPEAPKTAAIRETNLSVVRDALRAKAELEKVARMYVGGPSALDIAADMGSDALRPYQVPNYGGFDPFGESQKKMQVRMLSSMTGRQPVVVKHGSADLNFNPAETALEQAFAAEDQPYPYANPYQDSYEMRDKLAGAADHMTSQLSGLEVAFHDTLGQVYHQVKQASLEGMELGQILAAWEYVVPDAAYVKTAFAHIGPRLVEDGVFPGLDAVGASLQKTAHVGVLNKQHPLVGTMADYCMVLNKLAETRVARDELIQERNRLDGFIQKVGAAAQTIKKVLDVAGKGTGGATELIGKALVGGATPGVQRAAQIAHYAPHAAALIGGGLAAKDVGERIRYSKPGRYVAGLALPKSPEAQMRRARFMQAGMY